MCNRVLDKKTVPHELPLLQEPVATGRSFRHATSPKMFLTVTGWLTNLLLGFFHSWPKGLYDDNNVSQLVWNHYRWWLAICKSFDFPPARQCIWGISPEDTKILSEVSGCWWAFLALSQDSKVMLCICTPLLVPPDVFCFLSPRPNIPPKSQEIPGARGLFLFLASAAQPWSVACKCSANIACL